MTETAPLRAAIYSRISVNDKHEFDKVEDQTLKLRKLAADHGYEVAGVYEDKGISAWNTAKEREGWDNLLLDIRDGLYDVVLARDQERLSRDVGVYEAFQVACVAGGTKQHLLHGGLTDPRDESARTMNTIMSVFGSADSRKKSKAVKLRLATNRAAALKPHHTHQYGFALTGGVFAQVPEEAACVKTAYDMFLENKSLRSIARYLNDAGQTTITGRPWASQSVRELLLRPSNAALITHKKERVGAGLWEPIIDLDTFDAVEQILADRTKSFDTKDVKYLGVGISRCGVCGAGMRSGWSISRGKKNTTLRCSKDLAPVDNNGVKHPTVSMRKHDAIVEREIVRAFMWAPTHGKGKSTDQVFPLRQKLADLNATYELLLDALEAPGASASAISPRLASNRERAAEVEAEIGSLVASSARLAMLDAVESFITPGNGGTKIADLNKAAEVSDQIQARYRELDIDKKRTLVREYLAVTVNRGTGPEKVQVRHKIVEFLNDEL